MFKQIAGVCTGLAIIAVLVSLMMPAQRVARGSARRAQCMGNLKSIGLALRNYHDVYAAFPPAYTVDADGRRLHSWRTLLLPFLDGQSIYKKIDLSKPWNDPANAEAYSSRWKPLRCPDADCPENHTTYLAIVAPDGCMRPGASAKLSESTDNHDETLLVIEVPSAHAVHWMAPMDAYESLVTGFGPETRLNHANGMFGVFVSCRIQFLRVQTTAAQLRALLSIAGNDPLPPDEL